jgi:hypothetical protein
METLQLRSTSLIEFPTPAASGGIVRGDKRVRDDSEDFS